MIIPLERAPKEAAPALRREDDITLDLHMDGLRAEWTGKNGGRLDVANLMQWAARIRKANAGEGALRWQTDGRRYALFPSDIAGVRAEGGRLVVRLAKPLAQIGLDALRQTAAEERAAMGKRVREGKIALV